jgi:hypothetical protein
MSTEAQRNANRANAQLSTGPRTEQGKAKSSLNAVDEAAVLSEPKIQARPGLTGRTVLLPTEDAEAYQQHIARYCEQYKPEGDQEKQLTQSLADTQWRLNRIPVLEQGIYALGHREFAPEFENEDPSLRKSLIETKTFLTYQRQLNNLSIQESRLRRQYEKDLAELTKLQQGRATRKRSQLNTLVSLYRDAERARLHFDPQELGFEFTAAEVKAYFDHCQKQGRIERGSYYTDQLPKAA